MSKHIPDMRSLMTLRAEYREQLAALTRLPPTNSLKEMRDRIAQADDIINTYHDALEVLAELASS